MNARLHRVRDLAASAQRWWRRYGHAAALALCVSGAFAQTSFKPPPVSPAVQHLLDQDYLSQDERKAYRIRFGQWTDDDLTDPASRARAAIIRGDFADPALSDEKADPLDRAEGLLRRGEPAKALELLTPLKGSRASRVRAEALIDSGQDPLAELKTGAAGMSHLDNADELVESVRCALLLSRFQTPQSPDAVSHQSMLDALARVRDELDRLSWQANLAEAMLLYEKDLFEDMSGAIDSTLALNPRCAEALWIYGQACVDTFDFPRAESIADRLDELATPHPSPWGACLRAYIRLRQQEGDLADQQLAPALAAYPDHRLLRAYHAAAAAGAFNFSLADQRLAELETLSPKSPLGYFLVGKTMSGARQYEEAAGYLREAVQRAPAWAEPVVELGLSQFQAGVNDEATQALEKAGELDPLNKRAANSLMLLRELAGYATVEDEHFVVRCKPGEDEVVAREMLEPLEGIFSRVTGNGPGGIDHRPAHKTVVELYPNHRWFGVRITGMPQLHTIAAATGPVIAMETPREGPGHMGAFDWRRVVQHEFTHTVTLSRTKNRLPHWFTEASAVYLEDAPRDYSTVQLLARAYDTQTLFDFDTINIMFARPKRPTDRSQAYAQGHAMYEFMMDRFGPGKPLELMDVYAKGTREAEAFRSVLGVTRDEFFGLFRDWLGQKLDSWGMAFSDSNPRIKDLLEREKTAPPDSPQGQVPKPPEEEAPDPQGATPEMIERWLTQYPASPNILYLSVEEHLRAANNQADEAMIPLLERYAQARPVDPLPHKLLASYYLAHAEPGGKAPLAVPHLEYLDIREQHSSGYAMELARQYASAGDLEHAAAKVARATQIAPYDPANREYAARIALLRKDFATAERHIRALIVLEPDNHRHQERLEALQKLKSGSR